MASTIGDITTTAAINSYLKVMQKKLSIHFNKATVLLSEIKGKAGRELAGGRSVELPQWVMPNNQIAGVRGDAGKWSKGSRGKVANAILPIYPVNTTQAFGHIAELKTKQDVQSLEGVMERVVKDIETGFPIQLNKLLFLDGKGIFAKVASVAGLVVTVDAEAAGLANYFGTHYGQDGLWFHASTSDAAGLAEDLLVDAQIVGTDTALNTYTVEGNIGGLADNHFLTFQDSLNNVTGGLLNGIGDGTTNDHGSTYLSIDRTLAANAYFRSLVTDMNGAGELELALVSAQMATDKRSGKSVKMFVTTYEAYNKVWQTQQATRQFFAKVGDTGRKYALGFDAITVGTPMGNIEVFYDRHCPMGEGFGIDPADWGFAHIDGQAPLGQWYKDTSGNMFHEIPGTYRKECNWLSIFNFFCSMPRGQFRISEIPEAALPNTAG